MTMATLQRGRVGITMLVLLKTKQKKPKGTQAKRKAKTDLVKGKIIFHEQNSQNPFQSMDTLMCY